MSDEWTPELVKEKLDRNPDLKIHPDSIRTAGSNTGQARDGIKLKTSRQHPEQDLSQFVYDAVKTFGLLGYHTYRSKFSEPGYPDWNIIGRYQIIVELKDTGKNPTPAQQNWLDAFKKIGVPVFVWRPEDKDEIITTLADMRLLKF